MRVFAIRSASVQGFALVTLVGLWAGPQAIAQDLRGSVAREAQHLDVHVQADGQLVVAASSVPIDEVIRVVAKTAGLQVSWLGPVPHHPVTVLFPGRPADEILTALMNPDGISYVLTGDRTGGTPRRLLIGLLASESGATPRAAVPSIGSSASTPRESHETAVQPPTEEPVAPAPPVTEEKSEPTEWPSGIEPANLGAPTNLPRTREALFLEVNGSAPVTLPAGVTPNVGTLRPDRIEPVNPIRPSGDTAAVARPGMMTATGPQATPAAPPSTDMLKAPQTIMVPGPTVVYFPPPPRR